MALTHHTGIPRMTWIGEYPPCVPYVTIGVDVNPFCPGDSVTFTPSYHCIDGIEISTYVWSVNNVLVSSSGEAFTSDELSDGDKVFLAFSDSNGNTYFSNIITVSEKSEGCPITVKYGLLYNWYAATDVRNIAADGWGVPTNSDFDTLRTYLGGTAVAGGKLKETGLTYWGSPNTGASNEVKYNGRGAGVRQGTDGTYDSIGDTAAWFASNSPTFGRSGCAAARNSASLFNSFPPKDQGCSIRPFRLATESEQLQADGTACANYIGNDGKVYRTVKIGTQVWLADNLCETKYRNGDTIPEVTDNAAWAALTTGALCAYNNDWSNVLI